VNYEPSERWQFYMAYGRLDNRNPSTSIEQTQYARNSGALVAAHMFASGWTASLAAYASSGDGLDQSYYGRQDLTLSKTLRVGRGSQFTATAAIRHMSNPSSRYSNGNGTAIEGRYNDDMQYLLTLRLSH
jgi:hypothetical protein